MLANPEDYTFTVEFDAIRRPVMNGGELTIQQRREHDTYAWPNPFNWAKADYPYSWPEAGHCRECGMMVKPDELGTLVDETGGDVCELDKPHRTFTQDVGYNKEFVEFNGDIIDLSDMPITNVTGWDGAEAWCVWFGILIRYARTCLCYDDTHDFGYHGEMCPVQREMDTDFVFVARWHLV